EGETLDPASGSLGVDIGGVIIARADGDADTSFFSDDYLRTTAVPGAFDAVRRLVAERFGDRVFLVSKCRPRVQERTLHWLDHHGFHDHTGIDRSRVHCCRERHEKAGISETLGLTHFVDDRLEVLSHLTTAGTLYLFQPWPAEVERFRHALPRVRLASSWQ